MSILYQIPQVVDAKGGSADVTAEFFESGTSTPRNVYSDAGLETSLGTELAADGVGRFAPVYFTDAEYRVLVKVDGATLYEYDPIPVSADSSTVDSAIVKKSVADFKEDGDIDDTDGWQRALDYQKQTGVALVIPAGEYTISQTLTYVTTGTVGGLVLEGAGIEKTIINTTMTDTLLNINTTIQSFGNRMVGGEIGGFTVVPADGTAPDVIVAQAVWSHTFRDIRALGTGHVISILQQGSTSGDAVASVGNTLLNIEAVEAGALFNAPLGRGGVTFTTIKGCRATSCGGTEGAIHLDGALETRVVGCSIVGQGVSSPSGLIGVKVLGTNIGPGIVTIDGGEYGNNLTKCFDFIRGYAISFINNPRIQRRTTDIFSTHGVHFSGAASSARDLLVESLRVQVAAKSSNAQLPDYELFNVSGLNGFRSVINAPKDFTFPSDETYITGSNSWETSGLIVYDPDAHNKRLDAGRFIQDSSVVEVNSTGNFFLGGTGSTMLKGDSVLVNINTSSGSTTPIWSNGGAPLGRPIVFVFANTAGVDITVNLLGASTIIPTGGALTVTRVHNGSTWLTVTNEAVIDDLIERVESLENAP